MSLINSNTSQTSESVASSKSINSNLTVSDDSSEMKAEIIPHSNSFKMKEKNGIAKMLSPTKTEISDSETDDEKELLILSFLEMICSPQHLPSGANPDAYREIVAQLQKQGIISTSALDASKTAIKNIYHKLITQYNIPFQYLLQHNELVSTRYLNEFLEKEKLGSGGYGNVFRAYHKIDDHYYAIKKLPLSQYEKLGPEILREVRSLAKFNHPNIVRYYSSWIEYDLLHTSEDSDEETEEDSSIKGLPVLEGPLDIIPLDNEKKITLSKDTSGIPKKKYYPELTLFIQLELCHQTLQDYLTHRNSLIDELTHIEYEEAINIFKQIVIGIRYIHNLQYIHRDLKPANIFINYLAETESKNIQVKIGDFGLIRQTPWNAMSITGSFSWNSPAVITDAVYPLTTDIGTTIYAAPEQIKKVIQDGEYLKSGKKTLLGYNQKTDMYSLGIIFFELLSVFKTQMERHIKIMDLKNGKGISPEMEKRFPQECKIIRKLTQKNPKKRISLSELILPAQYS